MKNEYVTLREYAATDRQREVLDAVIKFGSGRKAAPELKISYQAVNNTIKAIKARAAKKGWSPEHDMTNPVPDGFAIKGTSTLYDQNGDVKIQWVKTNQDAERQLELMQEVIASLMEDVPRLTPLPFQHGHLNSELLNQYTITDYHMGMLAWGKETGADWDINIAKKVLHGCFSQMIASAPPAETCVINQLGDFLHSDGIVPVTPGHGNILDVDGRFAKIVKATILTLREIIDMALAKHKHVHVVMAEGNHDPVSSIWLRQVFAMLYENEPRITVDTSPLPYYAHQFGNTALFYHHGHLSKNASLPLLFATDFHEMWGVTTKRYIHTGHRHHVEVKEYPGATVHQHPTLAAKDAYAARGGWRAERRANCITYHKEFGEVGSNTVSPEMIEE
jgi:hypothetical protein